MVIINHLHPLNQLKKRFINRFLLLFLSALYLYTGKTLAQNIEITVLNKNSIPMPYAFILINGKPITVNDTLGRGLIPINKLRDNDTISVNYLAKSKTNAKAFLVSTGITTSKGNLSKSYSNLCIPLKRD
jgi:hypothetical protein